MFYPLGKNTEKSWRRVSVLSLNPNLFAYLQVNKEEKRSINCSQRKIMLVTVVKVN